MDNKSELLSQLRIDRSDDEPGASKWPWIFGLCLLLLISAAILWAVTRSEPLLVETAIARTHNPDNQTPHQSVLDATGYVVARRYATVSSKVTAKVEEVLVEEGMRVEKGQVVARLDDVNDRKLLALEQAGLAMAEAQLEETRARLSEAERVLERVGELHRRELLSESELDVAQSNVQSLRAQQLAREAQLLSAQRRVELQEQHLDDLILRAPFTGVVISKDAQPGEMISPVSAGGGFTRTGICSLVDMESLEIEVDVNESYIQRVQAGQPVLATLEAYPNWRIPAQVIAIVPTADRQRATVRVRVGFDELDPRILPQMGVKVAFLESRSEAEESSVQARRDIVVPRSAVHRSDGRSMVYTLEDNKARRRAVEVEARNEHEFWVTSGLSPGDRYVLAPPPELDDGVAVTFQ
ncbi:efflux RND transporter periplasmic adaptor subunit [Marinimicrobium alkaliphilum]